MFLDREVTHSPPEVSDRLPDLVFVACVPHCSLDKHVRALVTDRRPQPQESTSSAQGDRFEDFGRPANDLGV